MRRFPRGVGSSHAGEHSMLAVWLALEKIADGKDVEHQIAQNAARWFGAEQMTRRLAKLILEQLEQRMSDGHLRFVRR